MFFEFLRVLCTDIYVFLMGPANVLIIPLTTFGTALASLQASEARSESSELFWNMLAIFLGVVSIYLLIKWHVMLVGLWILGIIMSTAR